MRKLHIIGIGTGNPEHVTIQAVRALNAADTVFLIDKGDAKAELLRVRREICERYIEGAQPRFVGAVDPERDRAPGDYGVAVDDWHAARAELYERLIEQNLGEGESGAFLVWGDPSLYDSTLRIIARIRARGRFAFDCEVIPGITSVQALAAGHQIPLNGIGEPVTITTGRRLAADLSTEGATVVMLDGRVDFAGLDPDLVIHWGAYLGTADELLIQGRLGDVAELIRETRRAARARHGWIMDIYRLSRPAT
ncbi:precorrin-6A synthase (deacetylating) [Methylobacterium gnaphalii]|uniref:Precorrin-6A synthase [deacetylating] n=1 Tax=Methylobacterium gnaphalii TaxID=1010610 RepID=A0A512JHP3_9HYPH|nr:precorrin-6A synthase (deacetylating) [Methylobacterium gnaphalii]GEP09480.1 precorrin-6A synthase (deacetylating) [Methylobacterium gnaphalii]GJD68041.1 Cobalamin biosynthesis protein CobIJ [Methylobacterium gnaphalii]GLS51595.1 precorrin-6A synthase (deacetylating) [Methylobacterium gnaphalii]